LIDGASDNGLSITVSVIRYDPSTVNDWLSLAFQGVMAEAEARRIKQRNIDSVETKCPARYTAWKVSPAAVSRERGRPFARSTRRGGARHLAGGTHAPIV